MAKRYLETKGEIRPVVELLLTSPEFLDEANYGAKFKTPYQFVLSAARASAIPVTNIRPLLAHAHAARHAALWAASADGYKNTEAAWLNPDALTRRINFATALASGRLPLRQRPVRWRPGHGQEAMEKQAEAGKRINVAALRCRTDPENTGHRHPPTPPTSSYNPKNCARHGAGQPGFIAPLSEKILRPHCFTENPHATTPIPAIAGLTSGLMLPLAQCPSLFARTMWTAPHPHRKNSSSSCLRGAVDGLMWSRPWVTQTTRACANIH